MDELQGGIRRVTLPLPTRPGARPLVPPPGRGRLDDRRHRARASRREASAGRQSSTCSPGRYGGSSSRTSTPTTWAPPPTSPSSRARPSRQGRLDYEQCGLVWGSDDWADVLVDWFRRHGVPDDVMLELIEQGAQYRPFIRYQPDPQLLDPGDHVDGWRTVAAPGHADGQLMLFRDGVLVAADHVLDRISPTVGLWPGAARTRSGTTSARSRRRSPWRRPSRCRGTASRSTTPPPGA